MSHIKTEINNLFKNPKVYQLFSNSDGGQGLIDSEVDRYFSFEELEEFLNIVESNAFVSFLESHKQYHNLSEFFKRFSKRVQEVFFKYQDGVSYESILKMVKDNKQEILRKYSPMMSKEAQLTFTKDFIIKHKEIKTNTYEQVKDFFENPVSWV